MAGDLQRIAEFASRQYGVFSVGQARDAGFDRDAVAVRLGNGSWVRLCPGVYAVTSAPPTWERQLSAAVLSRSQAIVAGLSAAHLHGIRGFGPSKPVIMIPRENGNARSRIARVIRSSFFNAVAIQRVGGFLVTTPAETLLTLAADLSLDRLEGALEDVLLTGKGRLGDFDPIFDRILGSRVAGTRRLGKLIEARQPGAFEVEATYLERILHQLLSDPRVPSWTVEHPVSLNGKPGRVDVFIAEWSLVVEADSRRWHARQADFERDPDRDNALAAQGIQVIRLTYRMLRDEPSRCLATILDAGAHRSAIRRS